MRSRGSCAQVRKLQLLKRIIARKDLVSHHDVVDAIVNNPTTPVPSVSAASVAGWTVRRIAKQGRLRDAIVKLREEGHLLAIPDMRVANCENIDGQLRSLKVTLC